MSTLQPPWENYDAEYRRYQQREDIPVHTGLGVDDVRTLSVAEWDRTGGRGAFLNLLGMEGTCDVHVHEIPAGETLQPQRHLFEALVFVVSGTGVTTLESGSESRTFEWADGSLFYLPRNTRYVHANADSTTAARLLAVTPLPLLYTLLQDDTAIWENKSYDQWTELNADDEFYGSDAQLLEGATDSRTYWDANFIPDATTFDQLDSWPERGGSGQTVHFPFQNTSMYAHISEFQRGQYKKAHRHHPGANVMILGGDGYSLLWEEGDDQRRRLDWGPYSLFTPPMMWFHQHFNTSERSVRYLAMHAPQLGIRGGDNAAIEALNPTNQIEYHDEAPEIRQQFQRELERKGLEFRMEEALYQD
jgi:gentisate 1,2-dioxygenase